jgi:hypothetical protein
MSSTHSSEQEANSELVAYVKGNWQSEMNGKPPANDDEMVRRYFKEVRESYEVTTVA